MSSWFVLGDRLRISEVVQYLSKLDSWKQSPVQTEVDGRRVSTSDRTENGRYTLQSLMDDAPSSIPPPRVGVDLVPTSPGPFATGSNLPSFHIPSLKSTLQVSYLKDVHKSTRTQIEALCDTFEQFLIIKVSKSYFTHLH